MHTNFRQGIITYPASANDQVFLIPSGAFFSQQASMGRIDVTFAHGASNYLHTEASDVINAWGPFQPNTDYWLYWDIEQTSATRTFGSTKLAPVYGSTAPVDPLVDQHWFDTIHTKMFVYQTTGWMEVIRVFAAQIRNNVTTPLGDVAYQGTQVGINTPALSGRILLDSTGLPIIQSTGEFLTTENDLYVDNAPINVIKLEANIIDVTARENIANFQVVKFSEFGFVQLASYNDLQNTLIMVSLDNMLYNQSGKASISGVITNPSWNFTTMGATLWVTDNGLLTETDLHVTDPQAHPTKRFPIARVLTPTSIFFGQGLGAVGEKGDSPAGVQLASDTVYGLTRLSVPAVDPANPIIVGDNDPRLLPYAHPATHPASIITTDTHGLLTGLNAQMQLQQLADRNLGSLSDVSIPSPLVGDGLIWNGTHWTSGAISSSQYLSNLLDVSIVTPVAGQQLAFDGTKWNNVTTVTNLYGDVVGTGTSSIPTTLSTVNANIGSFGDISHTSAFTVNAKGLVTAATQHPISAATSLPSTQLDTQLWSVGDDSFGALGVLPIANRSSPVQVGSFSYWKSVSAGRGHSIAIHNDGTLWTWGTNTSGQLGNGTVDILSFSTSLPTQIGLLTDWKQADGGLDFTVAVKTNGTLWTWGGNASGQLGDGTTLSKSSPILVGALTNWKQVSCGYADAKAIKTDGTLWAWGHNANGQLGDGTTTNKSSPVQIGSLTDWSTVVCGNNHALAIKHDGTLWAWGNNTNGQLGDGTTASKSSPVQVGLLTNWFSVACGQTHSLAIKTDGTLWTWGYNVIGQLGVGDVADRSSPTQVGSLTNWKQVDGGRYHTVAIKHDGTLWACGYNASGQLGDGTIVSKSSPVQIGTSTSWTYAVGSYYQTLLLQLGSGTLTSIDGSGGTTGKTITGGPVLSTGTLTMGGTLSISAGGTNATTANTAFNNLAPSQTTQAGNFLSTDGSNTLWAPNPITNPYPFYSVSGSNQRGEFGNGTVLDSAVLVQVDSGHSWKILKVGVGIAVDGSLWKWGYDAYSGPTFLGHVTTPTRIGTEYNWSYVDSKSNQGLIKSDGTLWMMGSANSYGQLGLGHRTNSSVQVSSPTQVGTLNNWASVHCGYTCTAAVKIDGTLWTWGNNGLGQLGDSTTAAKSSPIQVGALNNWKQVAVDGFSTATSMAAIKTDGTLWTWGSDTYGQLGRGTTFQHRSSPVQVGTLTDWEQVTADTGSVLAIKKDGTLWAWGNEFYGQLGNGISGSFKISSPIQIGTLNNWKYVVTNSQTTVALKTDGTIWAWGYNISGQLGQGNSTNLSSPVQIGTATNWYQVSSSGLTTAALSGHTVILPIASGGTGQSTVRAAINALLPSQVGQAGKVLSTDGTNLMWVPKLSILP